jgi:hypothetical protein
VSGEGYSVQNTVFEMVQHAVKLTKAGVFEKHQAARTVFLHYCHNTAANDNPARGFRRFYVMPGAVVPRIVASHTGLSDWAVGKAMDWLHEQGLVEITERTSGKYRYVSSVKVLSIDDETEAERQLTTGKHQRSEVAPRKARNYTAEDQS